GLLEPPRRLAEMLVLEQSAHQVGTRIDQLAILVHAPRQQHLRLDPDQRRGHLEELARTVEPEPLDPLDRLEELLGDAGDRDVEDVDVLFPDQVEQQVERTLEPLELHDEAGVGDLRVRHHVESRTSAAARPSSIETGQSRKSITSGARKRSSNSTTMP